MKDLSTNQRNIENSCHIPDLVLTMSEETGGKNLVLQLGKISTFFTFVYSFVMLTKLSEQPKTITTKDKQKKNIGKYYQPSQLMLSFSTLQSLSIISSVYNKSDVKIFQQSFRKTAFKLLLSRLIIHEYYSVETYGKQNSF